MTGPESPSPESAPAQEQREKQHVDPDPWRDLPESAPFFVSEEGIPTPYDSVPPDGVPDIPLDVPGPRMEQKPAEPSLRDSLLFLGSIAAFDFFLYPVLGGTGYGLLMVAWALGFFALTPPLRRKETCWLYTLAIVVALRNIWHSGFFAVILPPLFLASAVVIQRTRVRHALDAAVTAISSAPMGTVGAIAHILGLRRLVAQLNRVKSMGGWALPVMAGVLVLTIFGAIFVQANPVVEQIWNRISVFLSLDKIIEWILEFLTIDISRVILWTVGAILTAALIDPLRFLESFCSNEQQDISSSTSDSESSGRVALVSLGVACLLFVFYLAIDVYFLWIAEALPPGISDSQYARRGTFWLTFSLLLSTLIIGAATAQSQLSSRWMPKLAMLAQSWVALDLLMVFCVLGRIDFYIDRSGLTPLRITGIFGAITVAAGIILMGMKIFLRMNLAWLIRRYVAVFFAGLAIFTALPRDTISARYNVRRIQRGDHRPLVLLFRSDLPVEGLTEYMALLDHPEPVVAEGILAYLFERAAALPGIKSSSKDENWRQFRAARWRAENALRFSEKRFKEDKESLRRLAIDCHAMDPAKDEPVKAWKSGQRSDLEWLDD